MIHFNVPPFLGTEFTYMKQAVENHKICGDGPFTKKQVTVITGILLSIMFIIKGQIPGLSRGIFLSGEKTVFQSFQK